MSVAKREKLIVWDAEPFCFGPISTTINVARELRAMTRAQDARFVLLGTLTSKQLAETSGLFDRLIECDTSQESALLSHRALIESASCFVSNTNFNSVKSLLKHGVSAPIVFIDTLFWMWDELEPLMERVHTYFVQDFWGVRERLGTLANGGARLRLVQPLIRAGDQEPEVKQKLVVVNLGGIENIYERRAYHCGLLVKLVLRALERVPELANHQVQICGGGETIGAIKEAHEDLARGVRVGCLSPDIFQTYLRRSEYFITLPGLTSFMESVMHQANTFLLPPQNYSQYLQMRKIQRQCPGYLGLNWDEILGSSPVGEYEKEIVALEKLRTSTAAFLHSESMQGAVVDELERFLGRRTSASGRASLPFFDPRGNGPADIAREIHATFLHPEGGA